ncbi:c-type cytochrome domain-containing protein [Singulisphaera sp. Ch08]|uniref:C-type cytochrome domain-containing protein n=1 Tax=Singulisphaera sp. Ch08 TaxID=3120278 RepID=A0AAU7C6Y0_9BACT
MALAASATTVAETVDYAKQIKPILSARCYSCHGALKQKSKFRTDSVKSLTAGGDSESAVEPGKSDESLLIERIMEEGPGRMPPPGDREALSADQIRLIKA